MVFHTINSVAWYSGYTLSIYIIKNTDYTAATIANTAYLKRSLMFSPNSQRLPVQRNWTSGPPTHNIPFMPITGSRQVNPRRWRGERQIRQHIITVDKRVNRRVDYRRNNLRMHRGYVRNRLYLGDWGYWRDMGDFGYRGYWRDWRCFDYWRGDRQSDRMYIRASALDHCVEPGVGVGCVLDQPDVAVGLHEGVGASDDVPVPCLPLRFVVSR